ncbi:MAG: hypothetical protein QOH71_1663 [Blastocatellia bacterium]|jgi:hypothetical protein|nr:hypothetical protein [Blastocatellia bacterium]
MNLARNHTRLLFAILVWLLIAAGQIQSRLLPAPSSPAISPAVVVSQVYGGGGNSGATFRNDFIELFNYTSATVDVSNWSVQYSSASGTSWQVTNLCPSGNTCTIAPGHYYLIQEAQGAGGTTTLPSPDASGGISMSASAGKVALVSSTNGLTGACPSAASMIDLVGYGTATCFEGTAAALAPGNSTAVVRINSGCTDTDKNNSDFITGAPNPRNSQAASTTCGVSPSPSPTPTPSPTPGCGVERWSVKTGTDADAPQVGFVPQATTIVAMRSWPAPSGTPANSRVAPYETTVWTVNATLTQYKLESDSDYHLVIKDQAGNTIVTEIPLPGCVGSGSPFATSIANARAKFDAMFTPDGNFQLVNVPIQITGVAMFDFPHGQTGAAPNGIEIHPVLDINFNGQNSIDATGYFVRQHYLDFLGREPDSSGFNFWANQINSCGADPQCLEVKRINVSAAFFLSIEFQQTGYLVERLYKASYGDASGTSTFNGSHPIAVPIVRLSDFLPDTQEISQGVVVGQGSWEATLENNKQAFCASFVQRPRFTAEFQPSMTAGQFVDKLNFNAGNPLSPAERDQLVASGKTRGQMLRAVAEHPTLVNSESNRAFVLMQYFGYLRRNPNDAPDSDYSGYDFWLTKLNQFNGNFQSAEMVKAFISSTEYRQRFGP